MDPATALSIVAAVLQVTEYGINAAKALQEISKHGSTDSEARLNGQTKLLRNASLGMRTHLANLDVKGCSLSIDQRRLQQIARQCETLAEDLLNLHDEVHGRQNQDKWHVAARWMRGLKSGSKISKIRTALERSQELLNTEIMVNTWYVFA